MTAPSAYELNNVDDILLKGDDETPIEKCKKICTYDNLFDVLDEEHRKDHVKGQGLY